MELIFVDKQVFVTDINGFKDNKRKASKSRTNNTNEIRVSRTKHIANDKNPTKTSMTLKVGA